MVSQVSRCRICSNPCLFPLLNLGDQYLTGIFPATDTAQLTRGPLELVKCDGAESCGTVQLRHTYPAAEMYGGNYGYRSSLNRSMVTHLRDIVATVQRRVTLRAGDVVLDIGSNDGTLLSFYPEDGPVTVGMDPTGEKFRRYYRRGTELITDFFSPAKFFERMGSRKASVVTSIAMFYDLQDPIAFMRDVSQVLADDGIWYFEQSYMPTMLKANAYDTICHEHVEYYGMKQIVWMAERAGLKILDVTLNDVNGGSFAVTAAKIDSSHRANLATVDALCRAEADAKLDTHEPYLEFARHVAAHRAKLLDMLHRLKSEGKKVLGYGASTKGNVILQYCGLTRNDLPAIADVNEDKFGHFTPGSNIPIVSEQDAHAMQPDYFLVLPWHFRQNLLERESAFLRAGGRMIFPLPTIEVISHM